jgi:eukaryotic-like serine/threonine-protein kinase
MGALSGLLAYDDVSGTQQTLRGPAIQEKIGRFEILEELGRGPMSVDYRAYDPVTDRRVVLTLPSVDSPDSPNLLRRFYREARAAGGLKHPNIMAIYDLGVVDRGSPYITRELLEGEDLGQVLGREKKEGVKTVQSAARLLDYIVQACRGLGYAHAQGVVHRDVKPSCIFVTTKGEVKLTQFVHARLPEAFSPVSDGTPATSIDYMSPEQVRGDRVDRAADIWAVGCTMYEILTHTIPFRGQDHKAQMIAIMSHEPESLREQRPDLPGELEDVVFKSLKKYRSDRYRNMQDVLADLEPLVHRIQSEV